MRMNSVRELFYRHLGQTSPSPLALEIEKAQGVYLYGPGGEKILDFISGISVSNLGHNHPRVVQAVTDQAGLYMHLMVYGELIQSPQVKLAEKLASALPPALSAFFFVNSGSEAVEGALKLAKRITGKSKVITFRNAYHGSTQGALSVCGNEMLKSSFRPLLPGVVILEYNETNGLDAIDETTAAVIVEPMQGEAGVILPSTVFLEEIRKRCDSTGALLIYDEIQTGFGRTGKLFAYEYASVIPDILVLGKALGGGMPMGAFISSPERMSVLSHDPVLGHITTFGGHPVCCAAALASLELLLSGDLIASLAAKEKQIRNELHHPLIREIRGKGLFLSVEFENEKVNRSVVDRCIQKGLLVDWFLFAPHCMRLAPPLIISEEEIKFACATIIQAMNEFTKDQ